MKLYIDIGNSSIVIGLFVQGQFINRYLIRSDKEKTVSEYATAINDILKIDQDVVITGGMICSVVPSITPIIFKAIKQLFNIDLLILGAGVKTGLAIKADSQSEVGGDLIACAVKVINDYQLPAIIIDLGTATTLSYIDTNKALAGVIIAPGLQTSANAICKRAALLPEIKLEAPKDILGRNSQDALKSGIVIGHSVMIDGLIDKINNNYLTAKTIIFTGGLAEIILPLSKYNAIFNPHLLLEGLEIIWRKNV